MSQDKWSKIRCWVLGVAAWLVALIIVYKALDIWFTPGEPSEKGKMILKALDKEEDWQAGESESITNQSRSCVIWHTGRWASVTLGHGGAISRGYTSVDLSSDDQVLISKKAKLIHQKLRDQEFADSLKPKTEVQK